MSAAEKEDDATGFKRPPRSGQFRKGQSGNPKGRPRRKVAQTALVPPLHPTRKAVATVMAEPVYIKDGSGRRAVPGQEALIRAIRQRALQGGTQSARTLLKASMDEDERAYNERLDIFDRLAAYKEKWKPIFDDAAAKGKLAPDILPHPDDIVLDWLNLSVQIHGAVEPEGLRAQNIVYEAQILSYELSFYFAEDHRLPSREHPAGQIGLFMALHLTCHSQLPPRLRRCADSFPEKLYDVARNPTKEWENDLRARSERLGIPFHLFKRGRSTPCLPMKQFMKAT